MLPGSPHLMSNVHIEHEGHDTTVEQAAKQYFGEGSAERKHAALAQYYRSRRMACIVFSVDETLSRRPVVSNDRVADFAESNSDIALAFGSFNPHRGPEAVAEARGLVASGRIHGLKFHPPLQQFSPSDRVAYPLYEVFAQARLPGIFHTGHSGIGSGMPGGGGVRLKYGNPMPIDGCRGGFPRYADHHGASGFPLARRSDLHLPAQAAGLHRSIRMVAEILFAHPGAIRQYAAETQSPVWFRLSPDYSRPLVIGFRQNRHPGRGTSLDFERECREVVSFEWNGGRVVRPTRIERVSPHDQAAENCWVWKEWKGAQPHFCHR